MTFEEAWPSIGPLVGVVVGGVLGGSVNYVTTRLIERQRWRQQKLDRLAEAKRKAIEKALAWLQPIERAVMTADTQVTARLHHALTQESFLQLFPHLRGELAKMDATADQKALLPNDIYPAGHTIIRMLDEVKTAAIRWGQEGELHKKPMLGLDECGKLLEKIHQAHTDLRDRLHKLFLTWASPTALKCAEYLCARQEGFRCGTSC